MVFALGFSSGLPLLLTFSTLSAWLKTEGISRTAIGLFALAGVPYAFKFLWAPILDAVALPYFGAKMGRRRSWGLLIQALLMAAILALGACDPARDLALMAPLALLVAFLSASQDIVIDAYRVEILPPVLQGPGAGAVQAGYRVAMLAAGAGALFLASAFGWFWAYAGMAAGLAAGMIVLLANPEPAADSRPVHPGWRARLNDAVVHPFADFLRRRRWAAILLFVVGYKMGEAMAGAMANPLYVELGFSLDEIAAVSKIFGFGATVAGGLIGGALTARLGCWRALLAFGLLQSAGNLFYVGQVLAGHNLGALAACVFAENLTAGMAGSALVAYISGLCRRECTATQYALLSSATAVGRTMLGASSGWLADQMGWLPFFGLTTVATVPALALLIWMGKDLVDADRRSEGNQDP